MAQQQLQDDARGNGHQHVVAAGLHPVVAAWWRAQVVAAPVVHHGLRATLGLWQAPAPLKVVFRPGTSVVLGPSALIALIEPTPPIMPGIRTIAARVV